MDFCILNSIKNKYYLNTIYIMKLNLVNICLSFFLLFLIVFFLLLPHFRKSKIEPLDGSNFSIRKLIKNKGLASIPEFDAFKEPEVGGKLRVELLTDLVAINNYKDHELRERDWANPQDFLFEQINII